MSAAASQYERTPTKLIWGVANSSRVACKKALVRLITVPLSSKCSKMARRSRALTASATDSSLLNTSRKS